jgi:hypothetical protein
MGKEHWDVLWARGFRPYGAALQRRIDWTDTEAIARDKEHWEEISVARWMKENGFEEEEVVKPVVTIEPVNTAENILEYCDFLEKNLRETRENGDAMEHRRHLEGLKGWVREIYKFIPKVVSELEGERMQRLLAEHVE